MVQYKVNKLKLKFYFSFLVGEFMNKVKSKITRITINPEAIRMVNKKYPGTIKDENKNYFSLNDIIEIEKKFLLLHLKK